MPCEEAAEGEKGVADAERGNEGGPGGDGSEEDGNEEETILEHKSDKRSRLNFMLDKVSPRLN